MLQTAAEEFTPPPLVSGVLLKLWNDEEGRYEIRPVDPVTDQAVPGYPPIPLSDKRSDIGSHVPPHFLSPDGKKLAAVESHGTASERVAGGTAYFSSADILHLVDVTTWRGVTATLPTKGWLGPLVFSPDATRLALVQHAQDSSTLMVYEADTGKLVAQRDLTFRPSLMAYIQDETALVVYGQPVGSPPGMAKPDSPRVVLVDARTLEVTWDQPLTDIISGSWCLEYCDAQHGKQLFTRWRPGVVPSHDGRKLYIVHADDDKLTRVDLDARTAISVEIRVARSWFERFLGLTAGVAEAKGGESGAIKHAVLSPDGKQLYVVSQTTTSTRDTDGFWERSGTHLGLQVIDVESGYKTAGRDIEGVFFAGIRFTPDGAHLLVNGWADGERWTEVADAKSLESVARQDGWEVLVSRRMDGQPIILASRGARHRTELAVLDLLSLDVVDSWTAEAYASWVTP